MRNVLCIKNILEVVRITAFLLLQNTQRFEVMDLRARRQQPLMEAKLRRGIQRGGSTLLFLPSTPSQGSAQVPTLKEQLRSLLL